MARIPCVVVLFSGLVVSPLAGAAEKTSVPAATPDQIAQTVDRAIGYLQT
jgi:hypothetical protein